MSARQGEPMRTLKVDESLEDAAYVESYVEGVEHLCGLVVEMFGDHPVTLLSPVFRQMILDKAQQVQRQHRKLVGRLHVDNPGDPLNGVPS
jgi:hypothetical protein